MLRVLNRSFKVATRVNYVAPTARNFSEKLTIPTDKEQQAGRRKEEMDAEEAGQVAFNRDPIIPTVDAGTKENPIMVRFSHFLG
jgi:hypothetical protein